MRKANELNCETIEIRSPAFYASESDPFGLGQNAPGAKLDAGKVRVGLVLGDFSHALEQVSRVGTFGAVKYSDHGWLAVANGIDRYTDAMLRHWLAEQDGATDDQTNLLHAAHLAWNALARLELMLRASKLTAKQLNDQFEPVP